MAARSLIFDTSPEGRAYKRETVAALWDLSPSYTEEEREEFIEEVGWLRGPYHKEKETKGR